MLKRIINSIKKSNVEAYQELKTIAFLSRRHIYMRPGICYTVCFAFLMFLYGFRYFIKKVFQKLYLLTEYSNVEIVVHSEGYKKNRKAIPFEYETWLSKNTPAAIDLEEYRLNQTLFKIQPLVSIIMPVYNTPAEYLRAAIDSVLAQTYANWELCIADDNSSDELTKIVLKEYEAIDNRIKVVYRKLNGHISASSNTTLEMVTGEYVSLFDHDDVLTPHALYYIVRCINLHPDADLIYSDEDKLDENGYLVEPYFKPDWSPDSLMSRNYITHFTTIKTSLIQAAGGFRLGYEGSQDYDLFLRVTELTKNIYHIPVILYHWRIHQMSTSNNSEAKPYAFEAGVRALQDALIRRGEKGTVEKITGLPGHYHVQYDLPQSALVSVVIVCMEKRPDPAQILSFLSKQTWQSMEIIFITSTDIITEAPWFSAMSEKYTNIRIIHSSPERTSRAKLLNEAARGAKGRFLLFLNSNITLMQPAAIENMIRQAQRGSIGVVGVKIIDAYDRILHGGVILGVQQFFRYAFHHFPLTSKGYLGHLSNVNNYSAVAGGCIMCEKSKFESVNGFDEQFENYFYETDLSLRLKEKFLYNVFLPDVIVKSATKGPEKVNSYSFSEQTLFQKKWIRYMHHDPHYNPNLTKNSSDYSIHV